MKDICTNKRAYFDYFIDKTFETGVELKGCEVKSMRNGTCSINEAFASIFNDELYLKNCYIKNYDKSTIDVPNEKRNIRLLLHKDEITKIKKLVEEKGNSIVPIKLFFNNKNFVKCVIGIGKGKKLFDKRETIKQRDIDREIKRNI